jgi:general secretion pathway protein H
MGVTDKKAAKVPMPTSAIGTSTRSRARAPRGACRGFSLLELLVVVTIIGIFTGAVVLSLGVLGNDREAEHEAFRLKSLLDLVHEQAVMQSRDYGVSFGDDGYRFYAYDYAQAKWVEPEDDKIFAAHELKTPLNMTLKVEDRDLVLDVPKDKDRAKEPAPQVLILSSGEMTPFEAAIYRDAAGGRFILTAGLDGQIEVKQDGFRKGG